MANDRAIPLAPVNGVVELLTGVSEDTGWIVFSNPERHNALTNGMLAELPRAIDEMERDPRVRAVVMTGAGTKAFVSGGDIRSLERQDSYSGGGIVSAFACLSKPLLAMVHGWCLGGGLLIALCADLRIVADDARFGIPAARLGVGYPYEAVEILVRLVGPANAGVLLLTAEQVSAQDALRMGLVNKVVPKNEVEDSVVEIAATIATLAPLSLVASKAAIRTVGNRLVDRDVESCKALIARCNTSKDLEEGRRAFLEKRQPRFTGM